MGKKTVATITYHRSDNFGSVLQAYALVEKLRQMGYEQYVIDYRKKEVKELYKILKPLTSKFNIVTDCYNLLHYSSLKRRQKRFEEFRQKHLRLSGRYENKQSLMDNPPKADCYIAGSDQVWNTGIVDFDESYFLDFVKEGRRIAYAASGIHTHSNTAAFREHLEKFGAVSVRENAAKGVLKEAAVCIDPVLLLKKQDWERFCASQNGEKPYMLCYFAGNVSAEFEHITKELARKHGFERVILMPEWRNLFRPGKKYYDAGPEEFVSLLQNATLVCTNSFHGTAFSVLMNRPFLVGQAVPFADDRIATLLGAVGLQGREIDPARPELPESVLAIDFSQANAALSKLRQASEQWLCQAIEGE